MLGTFNQNEINMIALYSNHLNRRERKKYKRNRKCTSIDD